MFDTKNGVHNSVAKWELPSIVFRMKNYIKYYEFLQINCKQLGFHGVMVSTQDSESCDPSSNLGGT